MLDNFLLFFLREQIGRLFCLDFIPFSGKYVEIQWKLVTKLNSTVPGLSSPMDASLC